MDKLIALYYNKKFRGQVAQVIVIFSVMALLYYLWINLQQNLEKRGITSGFEFLNSTAGFNIIMHLIDYTEQSTYFRAFLVGLLNTLVVASIGIIIATVLGVILGVARVSHNWLWAKIALAYVEILRNLPLLLQIFFWYFVVLRAAPHPRSALSLADSLFITSRGVYLPRPEAAHWVLLILLLTLWIAYRLIKKQGYLEIHQPSEIAKINQCKKRRYGAYFLGAVGVITICMLMSYDVPKLSGFNFTGGIVLIPEFLALLLALSLYTAAFIAEIVRSGIMAISKGQWEAARALGLNSKQTMRLIILPQATKVILPPLTNQYLNLTKNSSLAAAIAYPDLVSVFAGTVLNQTGQAVEIISITMGVYLFISISISIGMQLYEKRTNWEVL